MLSASSSMLLGLLLALPVLSNPVVIGRSPVTLSFARSFNFSGPLNIVQKDQARAQALRSNAAAKLHGRAVISEPVSNQVVSYIASVGVGSPATTYSLIVDTGSSNTWLGAGKAYVKTATSTQTANKVSVTYGSGSFSGTEFIDQVTLASGLVIPTQSIGVASTSTGFAGVDGILGIGPVDLTVGTLSPATTQSIPTVTDNLFGQHTITANEVAVSFEPTTVTAITNGELTFGGTDSTKFTGAITFDGIPSTFPSSEFWGITQTIKYSTSTSILSSTVGIVDTGTTLILISTDAFSRYQSATGGVNDRATGLLRITSTQFANLKNFTFTVAGTSFVLTPNAQIWPRSLNTDIGGKAGNIYLVVNSIGTPTGEGLDFINGYTFLERFYAVFDTAGHRVGLATTPFTTATTN